MINRFEIVSKEDDIKVIVYTINKNFNKNDLTKIASALMNPVIQKACINEPYISTKFSFAIEIGYLPGVTDNVANTTKEIIEDLLKIKFVKEENVYTSQITFITRKISTKEVKKIADSLYNPIIQRAKIKSRQEFIKDKGMGVEIPQVRLNQSIKVDEVNLNINDEELQSIGKKGITNKDGSRRGPLALDLSFMKVIQKYFNKLRRNPTDIELESIAQTWSEHCKHTIFADPIDNLKKGLFKTYIKAATEKINSPICVSVFTDNSGAIKFDKNYLITHKVETHNSPSALDPFGGAVTGIVGVNRDTIGFGLGAKPIINYYGFCLADPHDTLSIYKGLNFTQKMLSPRRIMDGVIAGVNSGGNCSGIPTPQGFMIFDNRYKGKPLVFVGTVGLIPNKVCRPTGGVKKSYIKKAQPGDNIVMVGGRVGLDGIHGATFSSEVMDASSPATAVQIGDPITQKKLSDSIIKEARNMNLYNSITDNGAGGLSCSVAEMAKESGGCLVYLDKVPLKYPGLSPWQIWISESQERMTLAIPKNKWKRFYNLMKRRGVEATAIGKFTDSGKCIVKSKNKNIMEVGMKFLHDGLPARQMKTTYNSPYYPEPAFNQPKDLNRVIKKILKRLNISSFEFLSMQYDHEVQGGSVLKPLQGKGRVNSDATIVRPLLNSKKGVIITQGIYPSFSDINTYHMAACSIDTAIRNAVVVGADLKKIALLDNFCWCSSTEPERLGQLKRAAKACYDYAIAYQTPFISGKDSMFNDFNGYDKKGKPVKISIPPTLLISTIGIIEDITKSVSIDLKFPGDLIYLLGKTFDELGGSEYCMMNGFIGNNLPKVNAKKNTKLYSSYSKCINLELISSAISINRGGLAIALVKTAIAGMRGIEISLKHLPGRASRDDFALFSESQGRILVSINSVNKKKFEKIMQKIPYTFLGKVTENNNFIIRGMKNNLIIKTKIIELIRSYKSTFKDF